MLASRVQSCRWVVLVGPYPSDETLLLGGVQAVVHGLATSLERRADVAQLDIYSLPIRRGVARSSRPLAKGVLHQLDAPRGRQALTVKHVPWLLRRLHHDIRGGADVVVHAHGSGLFQLALMLGCRLRDIPLVWTLHGITEIETWHRFRDRPSVASLLRWALYAATERLQQRVADAIIVDTAYVRRAVSRRSRRVHVIPAGIWLDEANDAGARGLERDPELVLSLGVIHSRKGHHLLLEAFAQVVAKRPASRLAIVGVSTDPEYGARLLRQRDSLGLRDSVTLHTDLPRSAVLALLSRASLFALHSREESQGIAICEAMAAGMPIVATRVGGIPDVVADGETGLLTAYGDIGGFADAMLALLGDPDRRDRMAARAREAAPRFAWASVAEQTLAVYRVAAGRRNAVRGDHERMELVAARRSAP